MLTKFKNKTLSCGKVIYILILSLPGTSTVPGTLHYSTHYIPYILTQYLHIRELFNLVHYSSLSFFQVNSYFLLFFIISLVSLSTAIARADR